MLDEEVDLPVNCVNCLVSRTKPRPNDTNYRVLLIRGRQGDAQRLDIRHVNRLMCGPHCKSPKQVLTHYSKAEEKEPRAEERTAGPGRKVLACRHVGAHNR